MELLDKAMRVAAQARAQLGELSQAGAAAPAADRPGPDASERQAREQAIARGAPDPFTLLTGEEAAALLGGPVGPPSLTYSDDASGVRYAALDPDAGALAASVYHGSGAADRDGPTYWRETILGAYDDAEELAGIGEQALWTAPYLFVLRGATVLYVEAVGPTADPRRLAADAARVVLDRLVPR